MLVVLKFLQQSDDISDHYLVLCKLHIAKTVNSTPCYKYGRTITSSTKDCFVNNLPDLSQFLSISNSAEKLKGIVHFEIKIWYLSAYPKGIQDVGVFFSSVDPI